MGTLILDRRCGKLGRLKLASGTDDPQEFAALNAMLSRLTRERRWDLLGLLQGGLVRPLELLDALHRGETHLLPTADEMHSLPVAVERWLREADLAARSKADYAKLLTFSGRPKIGALPELLKAARVTAIQSGKRQMFNNRLTAAQSFVRAFLGPESQLAKALPPELSVEHRAGNPQEPEQIRALALRFPYRDELWALCLTGMRRGEYWGRWEILSDRVQVGGTKTAAARRPVPLVYRPARPRIAYSTFYKALVRDSGKALNCHDLRKTAHRWWEDAGIPDWRIRLYAGHALAGEAISMTYRRPRELSRLLVEDAARIRAWLGDPPEIGLRVSA